MRELGFSHFVIAVLGLALCAPPGCSTSESASPAPPCNPNQFRSCEHTCGRGVQQCREEDGVIAWSECACVTLDAGFVEAGADGGVGGSAGGGRATAGAAGQEAGGDGSSASAGTAATP